MIRGEGSMIEIILIFKSVFPMSLSLGPTLYTHTSLPIALTHICTNIHIDTEWALINQIYGVSMCVCVCACVCVLTGILTLTTGISLKKAYYLKSPQRSNSKNVIKAILRHKRACPLSSGDWFFFFIIPILFSPC